VLCLLSPVLLPRLIWLCKIEYKFASFSCEFALAWTPLRGIMCQAYIWRISWVKKESASASRINQSRIHPEALPLTPKAVCIFAWTQQSWTNQIQNTMKTKIAVRCNELKINRAIMHNVSSMTMLPSNPTSNIPRHMISVVISRPASKYASI
jgi:hypothetical protein